jgi:hypothetical protein
LIDVADFNADGYNDLVLSGYEGLTSIFINKANAQLFNNTPEQMNHFGYPGSFVAQIKAKDLYNQGGIALTMSYQSAGSYGLKVINAVCFDLAPPPPVVSGSSIRIGVYTRPKIMITNNRGVKDFQKYQIFKAKQSTGWNFNLVGETTGNTFIDNSEYLQYSGGVEEGALPPNCYYAVKTVDASNLVSGFSKQIGYRVGAPTCLGCVEIISAEGEEDALPGTPEDEDLQEVKPEKFSITNFPNPFNPTTKIHFTLPADGNVKISVFNTAGQLVKVLINEFKNTGTHSVSFDGSSFSSGVYFYRIESNEFIETKRMILSK